MASISPFQRAAAVVAVIVLTLILAACGGPAGSPAPTTPASQAPGSSAPAVAIDLDTLVGTVADHDRGVVTVLGNLVAREGDARLCSALLESYPPQCGGASVRLLGAIPDDVVARLDQTGDADLAPALWGAVLVTGTIDADAADGPTLTIISIEIPPSG